MFGRATITLGIGPHYSFHIFCIDIFTLHFGFVVIALFMVALWNRETIYIFILFLSSSSFFARLISAVGDWMFTVLRHMVWS